MNELRPKTRAAVARIEAALERLRAGGMILVVDDFDRENEVDLLMAAEHVTADAVALMARRGRGLICQTITAERAAELALEPQERDNTALHGTAFTVSVDAIDGVATGISAADRAHTMRLIACAAIGPADLGRPGHVFPIVADRAGVFGRRGHTETGCDLARLAGLAPSAVICEVMNEDGTMTRGEAVVALAGELDLPLVSVEDLVVYRSVRADVEVEPLGSSSLPTAHGQFEATVWRTADPGCPEILAVSSMHGEASGRIDRPLVRMHSECLTGEAFGSLRCDCGPQLDAALAAIGREQGIVLYLRQEGRGIGLAEKIRAYALQDSGLDTVEANLRLGHRADERSFAAGAAVLRRMGIHRVRLLTNNPEKVEALVGAGIEVERVAIEVGRTAENSAYLKTKRDRLGHAIAGELADAYIGRN